MNTDISAMRKKIDGIDEELVSLFKSRMDISKEIGVLKKQNNMAIQDSRREQEVVDKAVDAVPTDMKAEASILMRSVMALSRGYQRGQLFDRNERLLPAAVPMKTEDVKCVYQGVPGAWGEQAARILFPEADLSPVEFFEDIFESVKRGTTDYGVVPIENSQTGAIGETYDLLRKFGCYVIGRTWIDIKHCLLSKEGAKLTDIRKVFSHPEGFRQCHKFLMDKSWDLIPCSNTAVAAMSAAESGDNATAAIGSRLAAELNGLSLLAPDVMDSSNNRTSFVVIGPAPVYDESSNLVSITFSLAHRSGSLCEALLPIMAAELNLTRIESRPSSSSEKYRFFAEIKGNIDDPIMAETLSQVAGMSEYLEVIGCYKVLE